MTYLIDTDILVDVVRGRSRPEEVIARLSERGIAISGMAYGELWEGVVETPQRGE